MNSLLCFKYYFAVYKFSKISWLKAKKLFHADDTEKYITAKINKAEAMKVNLFICKFLDMVPFCRNVLLMRMYYQQLLNKASKVSFFRLHFLSQKPLYFPYRLVSRHWY